MACAREARPEEEVIRAAKPQGLTMSSLAIALIALLAVLHLGFLVLEMFLWTRPAGMKVFRLSPQQAQQTKVLAANQGLYNGFLAAGLIYGIATGSREFVLFFLACVVIAGVYGAMTVNRRIFFVQALPALLAIAALRIF
jgi:putative membrane protein